MKQAPPIKTFAAMAREINRADVAAADRLRRSAPLRKGRKGIAVAKPKAAR